MLTDFKNYFTGRLSSKLYLLTYYLLLLQINISPYLKYTAIVYTTLWFVIYHDACLRLSVFSDLNILQVV